MNASVLSFVILLLVLSVCSTQKVEIKDDSDGKNITQETKTNITIFGASRDVHEEAKKQAEAAKRELAELKKDRSLDAIAKRILAEAE